MKVSSHNCVQFTLKIVELNSPLIIQSQRRPYYSDALSDITDITSKLDNYYATHTCLEAYTQQVYRISHELSRLSAVCIQSVLQVYKDCNIL